MTQASCLHIHVRPIRIMCWPKLKYLCRTKIVSIRPKDCMTVVF